VSLISSITANITRSAGDPKVLQTGPGSLNEADRLGRALGWFSIGLGVVELLAPRRLARTLGMEGKEDIIQAYGAREIGAGILTLSLDKEIGLWSRIAGDGLDIATLTIGGLRRNNPKRENVRLALWAVMGVTVLDIIAAPAVMVRHRRRQDGWRSYRDRSGFPQGLEKARGIAKDFKAPSQQETKPVMPSMSGV
jgi:hypothetical protein